MDSNNNTITEEKRKESLRYLWVGTSAFATLCGALVMYKYSSDVGIISGGMICLAGILAPDILKRLDVEDSQTKNSTKTFTKRR